MFYRVPLGLGKKGTRIVLEVETPALHPFARLFLQRIDRVRLLLATGRVSPDDAYVLLRDLSWMPSTEKMEAMRAEWG